MSDFSGKVALVTGAAGGIGRAVAIEFARAGADVVVADVSAAGQETVSEIERLGRKAVFVRADVQKPEDAANMVSQAVERLGRIDFAINNAAIDPEVSPEADWDENVFAQVIAINLMGTFHCMQHEIRQMLHQGGGVIVNMASLAGLVGVANKPAYTASKHAVVGLTRSAALQYSRQGIRVNAVCPGAVATPMFDRNLVDPSVKEMVAKVHPIGRMGQPEEIASAVLWLCSEGAGFVTGHALSVDGGLAAQ